VSLVVAPLVFTSGEFNGDRDPAHTNHTDLKPHVTAQLATDDQASNGLAQTIHIYLDANSNFEGYRLYDPREIRNSKDNDNGGSNSNA